MCTKHSLNNYTCLPKSLVMISLHLIPKGLLSRSHETLVRGAPCMFVSTAKDDYMELKISRTEACSGNKTNGVVGSDCNASQIKIIGIRGKKTKNNK